MIKKLVILVAAFATLAAPFAAPRLAFAANEDDVCKGIGIASGGSQTCDSNEANKVNEGVKTGIRIFQVVVGTIAVFMIILGGLRFITSSGDSGKISSGRNTVIYASIGLAIVALAEIIIQFVLNRLPS